MNEELQTLNQELQSKWTSCRDQQRHEKPARQHDIATLFLDDALSVRRFTPQMLKIIKLIPGDVGAITDLASDLDYPISQRMRARCCAACLQEIRLPPRRALVLGAHHALPHARQPHRWV